MLSIFLSHSRLGLGKGLGIQQETSVWLGLSKSRILLVQGGGYCLPCGGWALGFLTNLGLLESFAIMSNIYFKITSIIYTISTFLCWINSRYICVDKNGWCTTLLMCVRVSSVCVCVYMYVCMCIYIHLYMAKLGVNVLFTLGKIVKCIPPC